jgi:hypothetical protein
LDDAKSLWCDQKALQAAIVDQRELQKVAPAIGLNPFHYAATEDRLKLRLIEVQKKIVDLEP